STSRFRRCSIISRARSSRSHGCRRTTPPWRTFSCTSPAGSSVNNALWQLTLSRVRGFYREPSAMFWTFGFPILMSGALGVAFRNRPPEPVYVAVERATGADELAAGLAKSKDIHAKVLDPDEAHQALRTGKVALVVVPGPPRTFRFDP